MKQRTRIAIGVAAAAIVGTGAGIGVAATDDNDVPITGDALERAVSAALEHVGEGRVTDTEAGDEEGAYEVEVTLDDGRQIDVHLDENFTVIGTEPDSDAEED